MKCQKCRQPIKLHASVEDLSAPAFNLLIGASANSNSLLSEQPFTSKHTYPTDRRETYDRIASASHSPLFKRTVAAPSAYRTTPSSAPSTSSAPSRSIYANPAESFVYLTQSQALPPPSRAAAATTAAAPDSQYPGVGGVGAGDDEHASVSTHLRRRAHLFDILSARSDIDHPLCGECTDILLSEFGKRLAAATRERDAFVDFLKGVNAEVPAPSDTSAEQRELSLLEAEESAALAELRKLESEKAAVEDEIRELEQESSALDAEEATFWRERNAFALRLTEFQNERDGVNLQYDHDSRQLEKLQRTNVYNDTFCIGHDGYFGTINGLRLGRLPHQPVEWSEINAAWGQTLLLLATIADKLAFTFDGYRLKPMGSTSRIEKLDTAATAASTASANSTTTTNTATSAVVSASAPAASSLELFSSGDLPIGRMFMHRKFDQAMVAFLECLRQLGEFVERLDPDVRLPYRIQKDRIGDSCIRLAFNQDEAWTKACKYTLTCVKFLLAHTSNAAYAKRSGSA